MTNLFPSCPGFCIPQPRQHGGSEPGGRRAASEQRPSPCPRAPRPAPPSREPGARSLPAAGTGALSGARLLARGRDAAPATPHTSPGHRFPYADPRRARRRAPPPGAAGQPAPRAPRSPAHAHRRVPEQSRPRGSGQTLLPARLRRRRERSPAAVTGEATGNRPGGSPGGAGDGGDREGGVDGDKLVWGLLRGAGGRPHTRLHTRPHTRAHTRARPGGRGSPRGACGVPGLLPTPGDGAGGWGGGRRQLPGPRARAPLSRSPSAAGPRLRRAGAGPSARRRLRGDRARRPRCHFIPGRLGGGGGPGGGDAGPAGGAGRRRPGPTCARPAGRSGGTARGPGHALLPARPGGRPRPGVAAPTVTRPGTQPGSPEDQRGEDSPHPRAAHLVHH